MMMQIEFVDSCNSGAECVCLYGTEWRVDRVGAGVD